MHAILLNKARLNFEKGEIFNNKEIQRIKNIEFKIRKKAEKVKNFNSESCYDFSEYTELNDQETNAMNNTIKKSDESVVSLKEKNFDIKSLNSNKIINQSLKNKKFFYLKNIIKIFDILVCLFAIFGLILSQIENEDFYENNKYDRIAVIKLCNALKKLSFKIEKINLQNYNISYLNNSEIVKSIDFSNCKKIPLKFYISKKGKIIRIFITITTIFTVALIIISAYLDYLKEYIFKQNLDISFFKTTDFIFLIIEILFLIPFPYPNLKNYLIYNERGTFVCFPYSSILSAFSFLRIFFFVKLFKHLTKWTSVLAVHVCEYNCCDADWKFSFKAFQKDNPFLTLTYILLTAMICLGLSIRIFERYYWEKEEVISQDWNYIINCMWYVFVSMTTVGYGDFYAITSPGRLIAICACFIGNYFQTMLMVFMTQKSSLTENEKRSFELLIRLHLREKLKHYNAQIIFHSIKIFKLKQQKEKDKIINNKEKLLKEEDLNIASEVRKINKNITNIKDCKKEINSYGIIPITETLISIESRIDNQIKEIKTELEELQTVNEIVLTYTDDLMNLNRLLKKNLYATKLLYVIINKNPLFEKLSNVQQKYGEVFEMNIDQNEFENDSLENRDFINSKEYIDFLENMTPKEFKDNFNFIFNKRRKSNKRTLSSCKSLTYFRTTTANSMKRDKRIMLFKNNRLKKLQKITLKLNERISQIKIDSNKKEKNSKSTSVEDDKEKNKNNNQNNHLNNINKDNK